MSKRLLNSPATGRSVQRNPCPPNMKLASIIALALPLNAYATKPKDLLGKWEGSRIEKAMGSTNSIKMRLVGKRLSDGTVQLDETDAPFLNQSLVVSKTRYTFRPDGQFTEALVQKYPLGSTVNSVSGRGTWHLEGDWITVDAKYYGIPKTGTLTVDGGRLNLVIRQNFAGKFSTTLKAHR